MNLKKYVLLLLMLTNISFAESHLSVGISCTNEVSCDHLGNCSRQFNVNAITNGYLFFYSGKLEFKQGTINLYNSDNNKIVLGKVYFEGLICNGVNKYYDLKLDSNVQEEIVEENKSVSCDDEDGFFHINFLYTLQFQHEDNDEVNFQITHGQKWPYCI